MLIIAPLLLATPVFAQEQDSGSPVFNLPRQSPPVDPNREGPELDVFRGTSPTVAPPPVITPPPPVTTQPAPQPQAPAAAQPRSSAPAARQPAPTPAQPALPRSSAPAVQPPAPTAEPQPAPTPEAAAPAVPQPAEPSVEPPAPAVESGRWPWIALGTGLLIALLAVGWVLLRRRRGVDEAVEQDSIFVEDEEAPLAAPVTPEPAVSPLPPSPPKVVPPPPAPDPAPSPATGQRPWIDLTMEVRGARLSLMGATINYELTLHNRGERPAEDLLIRTLLANADTGQQALLQQFFAGSAGLPTHSVVSIAPGESQSLSGELRLMPDQIAPVQMGGRALLIPLAAFDAQYRWTEQGAPASGRTGRAFIVGQEQSPPADRLAPFRLDLGPRQYPTPGSRATALTLAS